MTESRQMHTSPRQTTTHTSVCNLQRCSRSAVAVNATAGLGGIVTRHAVNAAGGVLAPEGPRSLPASSSPHTGNGEAGGARFVGVRTGQGEYEHEWMDGDIRVRDWAGPMIALLIIVLFGVVISTALNSGIANG